MLALRRASSRASSLLGRGRTFAAIGDKAPDVALDVSFPGPKVCFIMHNLQSTSQQGKSIALAPDHKDRLVLPESRVPSLLTAHIFLFGR